MLSRSHSPILLLLPECRLKAFQDVLAAARLHVVPERYAVLDHVIVGFFRGHAKTLGRSRVQYVLDRQPGLDSLRACGCHRALLDGDPLRTLSIAFARLKICSQLHSSKRADFEAQTVVGALARRSRSRGSL